VRGFAAGPDLIRRKTREHGGCLIVEMNSMAESKRPEIALIVFGPTKSRMDHHGTSGADGGFDAILGYTILMMTTNAAVLDTLTFDE
jgi:hypothetical protein